MDNRDTVVFLHGLGVGPEAWHPQIAALDGEYIVLAPRVAGFADDDPDFSMVGAARSVVRRLDEQGIQRAHVCGLSLGAMIALQIATEYPDRISSLTLSAGQIRPPRMLMAAQSAIMRLLPARIVAPEGMSKRRLLGILDEVSETDFGPHLGLIAAPVLVLCGSKDSANIPAARALAARIPDARLRIIAGGGHQLNTDKPEEFTRELRTFLDSYR